MKTKSVYSLLAALLCVATAYAQTIKKPGRIVLNNGDTLRGWVNYKAWRKNPTSFTFYADSLGGKPALYKVGDVRLLEITGLDVYKRAFVTKDQRPVELENLMPINEELIQSDTVLLRALVLGKKVSLYELSEGKRHYYVETDAGVFTELVYKVGLNAENQVITLPLYKNLLNELATRMGREEARMVIDGTGFSDGELCKAVAVINNEPLVYAYKRPKGRLFSFFAGAGIVNGKMNISGQRSNVQFNTNVSGTVLAGVDFHAIRGLQDLVLRLDVVHFSYDYFYAAGASADFFKYDYYLKGSSTLFSLSVLYNFFRRTNCKVYVGLGTSYNRIALKRNEMQQKGTGIETVVINNYFGISSSYTSSHARVGVLLLKRLELYGNVTLSGIYGAGNEYSMLPKYYSANVCFHL